MAMDLASWPADTSDEVRETTVGSILRDAAASAEDAPAMVAGGRRWTYGQLLQEAETTARALAARFEPGERIAVWAPNIPEWVVLEFGAALAGLVLVTVNPAYRPSELAYVLGQSRASGLFMVPEFRSPMAAYLEEVRGELPDLRDVVLFTEWPDFVSSSPAQQELPDVSPSDAVQIQYTSGTTGFPKGATLTHRGLTNNARFYAGRLGIQPGDVYVNPMPMFHTAGCAMGVLGCAQSLAVHAPVLAFDPAAVLDLIEQERAAWLLGVPTMLIAIMEHPSFGSRDLSSLQGAVSGGAPVPATLVQRIEHSLGIPFTIVFGTTECSPLISQTRASDSPDDRAHTLGQPMPRTEVKVVNGDGETVKVGEVGELLARGYMVMAGYDGKPVETKEAIDDEGWYHTGDLASMDDRGFLRIEGRAKDMIIRGGENIYPREIEDVLLTHPAVGDAAVVGVPDDTWGEVVIAFVRLVPGQSVGEAELRAHCREHLAPYKTPADWRFVEEFPLTASGKIQKYKLRSTYEPISTVR